jgi:hypothetical protein
VSNNYLNSVTPAKAGVQKALKNLDSGFRRNDIRRHLKAFRHALGYLNKHRSKPDQYERRAGLWWKPGSSIEIAHHRRLSPTPGRDQGAPFTSKTLDRRWVNAADLKDAQYSLSPILGERET